MEDPRAHDTKAKPGLARGAAAENQPRLTLVPRVSGAPAARADPLRWVYAPWAICVLALFALHFPHLLADFPNNSPWLDPSKYTDEGWYGNAAVRHFVIGHWFLRGDFNPAIALPVWPILLGVLFHFTGVSLTADRALDLVVFGLNLLLAYEVVRTQAQRWAGLLAVTLLVSSPFLFAFSRLAILEPPLMCLLLLSWVLALRLPRSSVRGQRAMLAAIGLLICLMILTKTTAVFLLPSTLWLVAHAYGLRWKTLRALLLAGVAAAIPWCAWYFLFVRPRYRVDYHYLFEANHWPQPTGFKGWVAAFWYALHGSVWISPTLCVLVLVVMALALIPARAIQIDDSVDVRVGLWRSPITIAALLAAAGYVFFAGWHNNPQPRYYETVIYPLCFVLVLGAADLIDRSRPMLPRLCGGTAIAVMAVVSVAGVARIVSYVRHPEYTLLNAAQGVTQYIDRHPGPNRLLLSISGDQIEMITGMPSICDDYGTWDLPYRIHVYQPGWYATWNELDPGTVLDLSTQYSLEQVASFPAFDDPDRNVLILYRMVPLPPSKQTYLTQDEAATNAGK
jgi:4-amino-4-deoxy-L-arabinose transferase-like glycosyltransferase